MKQVTIKIKTELKEQGQGTLLGNMQSVKQGSVYQLDEQGRIVSEKPLPITNPDVLKLVADGVITEEAAFNCEQHYMLQSAIGNIEHILIQAKRNETNVVGVISFEKDNLPTAFKINSTDDLVVALLKIKEMTPSVWANAHPSLMTWARDMLTYDRWPLAIGFATGSAVTAAVYKFKR